ncbi:MAG: hypothetical protein K8R59_07950 [Thermoanaerobaculales bacterium]|nr:hypothetical protein [Thermoanaerobaculales bacterium]
MSCVSEPPPYSGSVCWGEYDGTLRTAILAMKHGAHDELAPPLAKRLAARVSVERWVDDLDLVTAVPSHPLHRLQRGFTAAELLAHGVSAALNLPCRATLRRHGLGRQMGQSRTQRLNLGPNRFSLRRKAQIEKRRILLVDDVSTTGSTMSRAAQTLLSGGATEVFGAILALAPETRRLA